MDIINTLLEKKYSEGLQLLKECENINDIINFRSNNNDSILHILSSENGTKEILELLIERGMNINLVNSKGETPLHNATSSNNVTNASCLIQLGCDPNIPDGHGQTPLHIACQYNFEKIAILLINFNKTKINEQDGMGRTPLHWSCLRDMSNVTQELIKKGAKLKETFSGETPLHWCVKEGNKPLIKFILESFKDLDLEKKNDRGVRVNDLTTDQEILDMLNNYSKSKILSEDKPSTKVKINKVNKPKKISVKLKK